MEGIRGWGKSALMCLWVCPGDAGTDNPREPSECPSLLFLQAHTIQETAAVELCRGLLLWPWCWNKANTGEWADTARLWWTYKQMRTQQPGSPLGCTLRGNCIMASRSGINWLRCQGNCYLCFCDSICVSLISCNESLQSSSLQQLPSHHPSIVCKATKASGAMQAGLSYLNKVLADEGLEQRNC